jgi:hypothetical protein
MTRFFLFLAALMAVSSLTMMSNITTNERHGSMSLVEGRRYMVAFPQVWASPTERPLARPMQLFISSKSDATVEIRTPSLNSSAPRISRTLNVKANQVTKFEVSIAYMNVESETRNGFGIEVIGNKPISVSTYQAWSGNGELARHLPIEAWGKSYYTMNFYQDRYGTPTSLKHRPSQILIIADKNNTVITYRPTFQTEGGTDGMSTPKNGSQTVTLDRGETFLIKSKIDENLTKDFDSDLSGTLITGNKTFSVISGHTKLAVMRYPDVLPPSGAFTAEAHFVRNNVHDAMLPLEMAGKEFVTVPIMYTPTRVVGQSATDFGIDDDRGDVIRVIALEENTTVRIMRQDGSDLASKFTLRRVGETRIDPMLEMPTYWVADKPILMGQYGKSWAKIIPPVGTSKGDEPQGHPTVESGMPMLQYIPSVDRWVNYAVFSSPEGMDNFFNIAFKIEEISKIRVDGRLLTSAFGGSMRPILGTPFAQIRTPIGTGDHIVESTDPNVKWVAWSYGSLDGMNQGRAYGTPIAIDLAIPCDDSISVRDAIVCGDVEGTATILPASSQCGSIFSVYADNLSNYTFTEEEYSGQSKEHKFYLTVVDKTKDATATILAVSRSGKFIEKTYTYTAPKISWTPDKINFGILAFNTPSCSTAFIKNEGTDELRIKRMYVKRHPNVFTITPNQIVIGNPNVPIPITICATISTAREMIDTLIIELECLEIKTIELRARGADPIISVGDRNWGILPASSTGVERTVDIVNVGTTPVIIKGYNKSKLDGTGHFFNVRNLDEFIPMTLDVGEKHTFFVTYSPKGESGVPHREDVEFYTNANGIDTIAVLIGEGNTSTMQAVGFEWNERVIDRTVSVPSYYGEVLLSNIGTQPITIMGATIVSTDNSPFAITPRAGDVQFPIQINNTSGVQKLGVSFTPNELPMRMAERSDYQGVVRFSVQIDSKDTTIDAPLEAVAWQPHLTTTSIRCDNFEETDLGYVSKIELSNSHASLSSVDGMIGGTGPLSLISISSQDILPNGAYIGLLQTATLQGGQQTEVTVTVQRGSIAERTSWTFNFSVDSDAPYDVNGTIDFCAKESGEWTVAGAYGESYVFHPTIIYPYIHNETNEDKMYNLLVIRDDNHDIDDSESFSLVESSVIVGAKETKSIPIVFTPEMVTRFQNQQTNEFLNLPSTRKSTSYREEESYRALLQITEVSEGTPKFASLVGDGIHIQTSMQIIGNGTIQAGKDVSVNVMLIPTPQSIETYPVHDITIRVSFNPTLVSLYEDITAMTRGTLLDGWDVVMNVFPLKNGFEIQASSATNSLQSTANVPLLRIPFSGMLGVSNGGNALETSLMLDGYILADFDGSGEEYRHIAVQSINGVLPIELNCANVRRLVSVSGASFSAQTPTPNPTNSTTVLNYGIGLPNATTITLMNSMGQTFVELFDGWLSEGEYSLSFDASSLPSGTYFIVIRSGEFHSSPMPIIVVK